MTAAFLLAGSSLLLQQFVTELHEQMLYLCSHKCPEVHNFAGILNKNFYSVIHRRWRRNRSRSKLRTEVERVNTLYWRKNPTLVSVVKLASCRWLLPKVTQTSSAVLNWRLFEAFARIIDGTGKFWIPASLLCFHLPHYANVWFLSSGGKIQQFPSWAIKPFHLLVEISTASCNTALHINNLYRSRTKIWLFPQNCGYYCRK